MHVLVPCVWFLEFGRWNNCVFCQFNNIHVFDDLSRNYTSLALCFLVPVCSKNFNLKPALQSDSVTHLRTTVLVFASAWEKISVELPPPAHHLLPLTGDQQLVEERAVGEGEATSHERCLQCRERLKPRPCRIHIDHRQKTWLREIIDFIKSVNIIKRQLFYHQGGKDSEFDNHQVPFELLALDLDHFQSVPPVAATGHPSPGKPSQQNGAWADKEGGS